VPDRDDERLEEPEPAHKAAFGAFRRSPRPADLALRYDHFARSDLPPEVNPDLARRVYDGSEGTIDLVPGRHGICCVAMSSPNGAKFVGTLLVASTRPGIHGAQLAPDGRRLTVRGVMSARERDLRIVTGSGREATVPLNGDDAYWMTFADALAVVLTDRDGHVRQIPMGRRRA
jgi:hypothetical protein